MWRFIITLLVYCCCTSVYAGNVELTEREIAESNLSHLAQDQAQPLEVRVNAVIQLGNYSGVNALISVARASRDTNYKLRLASLSAVQTWSDIAKWDIASPLLSDTHLGVQHAALKLILPIRNQLNEQQWNYVEGQANKLLASNALSELDQAIILMDLSRYQEAEQQLSQSHIVTERLVLVHSELLKRQGKIDQALNVLNEGLDDFDKSAAIYNQKGLLLIQLRAYFQAESQFQKAVDIEPTQLHYLKTLATVQLETSSQKAVSNFERLYELSPGPENLYAVCHAKIVNDASLELVDACINQLAEVAPQEIAQKLTHSEGYYEISERSKGKSLW